MDQFTPEQAAEQAEAWGAWMGKGGALADGGAPFGAGTALTDDDSSIGTDDLTGYTIVDAADLNAAEALADGHPFLSEGKGRFSVEVFELGRV